MFFLTYNVIKKLSNPENHVFFSNVSDNVALGVQIVERGRKIHEKKTQFISLPLTTYEYNINIQEFYNTLNIIYIIITILFTKLNVG